MTDEAQGDTAKTARRLGRDFGDDACRATGFRAARGAVRAGRGQHGGAAAAWEPGLRASGAPASSLVFPDQLDLEGRDFGEVLRHELNNPLTGILGNAELLLLEVRRGRLEIPAHNLQRLETITDLTVPMRETVRLLSDRWKAAGGNPSAEKEPPLERPQSPAHP